MNVWTAAVIRDPEIIHRVPVFRGTRVPVQTLFDHLEAKRSMVSWRDSRTSVVLNVSMSVYVIYSQVMIAKPPVRPTHSVKNGELMLAAETAGFDVIVTVDQNIPSSTSTSAFAKWPL